MKKQRTLRRRMTGTQIIGLILMLAGFGVIFATGISASRHGDHILTESESEYMEQADSDEEKDLLESWINTKDRTRRAAEFPLLLLSGFLVVAGAPLFYTPFAVEAHKSRMSRREDAEERRLRNRSEHASKKIDRELKKEEERALAEAEAVRKEQKKKWERNVMERAKEALDSDNAQPAATVTMAELEKNLKQRCEEAIRRRHAKPEADEAAGADVKQGREPGARKRWTLSGAGQTAEPAIMSIRGKGKAGPPGPEDCGKLCVTITGENIKDGMKSSRQLIFNDRDEFDEFCREYYSPADDKDIPARVMMKISPIKKETIPAPVIDEDEKSRREEVIRYFGKYDSRDRKNAAIVHGLLEEAVSGKKSVEDSVSASQPGKEEKPDGKTAAREDTENTAVKSMETEAEAIPAKEHGERTLSHEEAIAKFLEQLEKIEEMNREAGTAKENADRSAPEKTAADKTEKHNSNVIMEEVSSLKPAETKNNKPGTAVKKQKSSGKGKKKKNNRKKDGKRRKHLLF